MGLWINRDFMPRFSAASLAKLETCHFDLQTIFHEVIQYYDCTIVVGHRNESDQDKAVAAGLSQTPWPTSKHNSTPSMAVDAIPDINGIIDWNASIDIAYFAGYVMATARQLLQAGKITHQLRYGGDWLEDNDLRDNHFNDRDHFELI